METQTLSSQRKHFGQYFTKAIVGDLLVSSIGCRKVDTCIELSAGDGALIEAAHTRWPSAHFFSVDIDPNRVPVAKNQRRSHYVADALQIDLPKRIGLNEGSADVALCNPPFTLPQWDHRYEQILRRAGLPVTGAATFGADAYFLAQNLWMLRDEGELGIVVPAGLVSGHRSQGIREALLMQHEVHQVIELPPGAFSGTEVQTYVMCIKKGGGSSAGITLQQLDSKGGVSPSLSISATEAATRMDYSHYCYRSSQKSVRRNPSLLEVHRGNIELADARRQGIAVLHTTEIGFGKVDWRGPQENHASRRFFRAKKGDVLLARVGRGFFSKIGIIETEDAIISDCIFSVRSEKHSSNQLLMAFLSCAGQAWLKAQARGSCARYLTKEDLERFPIEDFDK